MDKAIKGKILDILRETRDMSLATLRPDGWPQATTVGFGSDGLTLYFLCSPQSQKAANLAHDDRVSLTIDRPAEQVIDIRGLSMAARASRVTDPAEANRALGLVLGKYAPQTGLPSPSELRADEMSIFRLTPTVISVLDYSLGFGHADLVECPPTAEVAASG